METETLQKAIDDALWEFNRDQAPDKRERVVELFRYALIHNRGNFVEVEIKYSPPHGST